ncbi:hypothetical protein [Pseudoxanthomonas kaohsiungensis]|uniref:DUF2570 domain-containing protein n=1 Tax=Pseudoxanthomonas kaohsiungensis TaxID=283923 RepID=A0ABW3LY95_9GAMM|nr:hypothetical protein [Pseudoxanthomonas kaohsiungensis]KAF1702874.1 hypothetical protein CSC66_08865 [Pseudoxanthomonas kaohsiungensis]
MAWFMASVAVVAVIAGLFWFTRIWKQDMRRLTTSVVRPLERSMEIGLVAAQRCDRMDERLASTEQQLRESLARESALAAQNEELRGTRQALLDVLTQERDKNNCLHRELASAQARATRAEMLLDGLAGPAANTGTRPTLSVAAAG